MGLWVYLFKVTHESELSLHKFVRFSYHSSRYSGIGVCTIFFKSFTASVSFFPHGGGFFLSKWDIGLVYVSSVGSKSMI